MTPNIEKLTTEILMLSDTLERDRAESVVEIGERMLAVREVLARGAWGAWIEEVPYTEQSARNYMGLARWAREETAAFGRMKSLGPTKLYALQRLSAEVLAGLPDPGSEQEPHLERLSVAQVHALVREMLGESTTKVSIKRVLASTNRRLKGLGDVVETLVERREELEPGTLDALRGELEALLASLEELG